MIYVEVAISSSTFCMPSQLINNQLRFSCKILERDIAPTTPCYHPALLPLTIASCLMVDYKFDP